MRVRAGRRHRPQTDTPAARARHHNRVLQEGVKRAELLEPKLAAILEPILRHAGEEAARQFEARATNFLTASGVYSPTSTMVALIPRAEEQAALEHAGTVSATPANELHVTLCYLGEVEGDLAGVVAAIARAAAAHAPLEGSVAGIAAFQDNGKGNPSIVLPSVPGLVELRVAVTEALTAAGIDYSRDYGYVPHMTVAYGEPDSGYYTFPSVGVLGQPLHFDALAVWRGGEEHHTIPLTGVRPVTAAAFGAPGEPGIANESPTAGHPGANVPIPAGDPAAQGPEGVGYRTASTAATSCATCSYYSPGTYYRCGRFDVFVDPANVCDAFEEALVEPLEGQDEWQDGDDMIGRVLAAGEPHALLAVYAPNLEPLTAAAGDPPPWSGPVADELIDVEALVKSLRTKTDPVRQAVIETVMSSSLANVGIEFDATNPFTAKVLAQSGSQIVNIADTTRLNVMRIIRHSYDEGLTIPDTAKAIRAGMREASVARATLIARTELAGAVNGGSVAATQIVSAATGIPYTKTWHTSVGAPYPRHEDYEGLEGQTVGLDDYFDVGGYQLAFPGDPDGPPEEVCNCRCTVIYTEASGDQTEEDAG